MKAKKLTRSHVARACACSVGTVRRAEGKFIFPRIVKGVRVFDPVEVRAWATIRGVDPLTGPDLPPEALVAFAQVTGESAAEIVRLLLAGKSFHEVLLLTRQNVLVIRELQRILKQDLARHKRATQKARERVILSQWAEELDAVRGADKDN